MNDQSTMYVVITTNVGRTRLAMHTSVVGKLPFYEKNEHRIAKELRRMADEIEKGCYFTGCKFKP